ncbi:hypothetical protein VKT23_019448 [Stygiomarasmius scandens]|uniref:Ribonuclease H1 N-terminal domain-containing protein n=1 Tax=Marasmiellus scandens TaxID=2682957 RepID=A0ABR1IP93_9AGAR
MSSVPGNFQLPPGSKLIISRPGPSSYASSLGYPAYKVILDAGQVLTVEALSPDLGIPQIPTVNSIAASPSTHPPTSSPCSPRPVSPAKPSTKRLAVVPPGSPNTPRHSKKKAILPSLTKSSVPVVLSDMSDIDDSEDDKKKVIFPSLPKPSQPAVVSNTSDADDSSENEYWKHVDDIDGSLIPVSEHPVYRYRGFARLAHPDELSWDGSRGNTDIYVITRGRRVGLFADWSVVQDLTSGVPDPFYKKCTSVDDAINLYTGSYNGIPGYKKIEVLNAKRPLENPIVDDWRKPLKGLDVDILVEDGEYWLISVVPVKDEAPITNFSGLTPSQVLSPQTFRA